MHFNSPSPSTSVRGFSSNQHKKASLCKKKEDKAKLFLLPSQMKHEIPVLARALTSQACCA